MAEFGVGFIVTLTLIFRSCCAQMIPVGEQYASQTLECISKDQDGRVTKTPLMGVSSPQCPPQPAVYCSVSGEAVYRWAGRSGELVKSGAAQHAAAMSL